MDKDNSLAGILVGLLFGAVIGAGVFYLSSSLNLLLGLILMVLFSVIGSITGWFVAPSIADKLKSTQKPLTDRPEFKTIIDSVNDKEEAQSVFIASEEFFIDYVRLGILVFLFLFISLGFAYLTWYEGIDLLLFVFGFFALSMYQLGVFIIHIGIQIKINPDGFQHKSWGKTRIIKWKEVDYIWEKHEKTSVNLIPIQHVHFIKLLLHDGTKIKLNRSLKNFSKLAEDFQEQITRYQLPIADNGLNNNKLIKFGPFKISNNGIQFKEKGLPWSEIDRIIIHQARIQVRKTGKNWTNWAETKTWKVPNFRLFVILASKFAKVF